MILDRVMQQTEGERKSLGEALTSASRTRTTQPAVALEAILVAWHNCGSASERRWASVLCRQIGPDGVHSVSN